VEVNICEIICELVEGYGSFDPDKNITN